MERSFDERRRRVVVLSASVATMSAATTGLRRSHPTLSIVMVCLIAIAMVFLIIEAIRVARARRRGE